jgi:hypothetical protein
MPHIKSYLRYRGTDVAWMYVGSHNMSKAGVLTTNGSSWSSSLGAIAW